MAVLAIACVPALALLLALVLLADAHGGRRGTVRVTAAVAGHVREEDRVRPALDEHGAKTWVDAEQLVWHEILPWPNAAGHGSLSRLPAVDWARRAG